MGKKRRQPGYKPTSVKDMQAIIESHGGELMVHQQKKHFKYKMPDGRVFVMSKSPSDTRAIRNNYSFWKKFIRS